MAVHPVIFYNIVQRSMRMNTINIGFHNLTICCFIGILEKEQLTPQDIIIDLKVTASYSQSGDTESMDDSIDYTLLANACIRIAQKEHFMLLETFAEAIVSHLLLDSRIDSVWVCIKKPAAIPSASYAYVELQKKRETK